MQRFPSAFTPFILLLVFLLFTISFSQNIFNGFYHLFKLLEFSFVGYYVAISITTSKQISQVFFVLALGAFFESALAIAQFIKQGSLGGIAYLFGERMFTGATPGIANASINGALLLRPYGTFPHPNVLAGFLVVVMNGLLFLLPTEKNKLYRVIFLAALLIGSSALILTLSRIAGLLWFALLLFVFLQQKKWIVSVALITSIIAVGVFTPLGTRLLQTQVGEEAFVQREGLIQSSLTLFSRQPIIGVGFGNFLPALAIEQESSFLGFFPQPVHNIFLLVLTETGIVGFGFFVWFLVKTCRRLVRMIEQSKLYVYRLFLIQLFLITCLGLFDHYFLTLQQGELLFAVIVGLCWATITPKKSFQD